MSTFNVYHSIMMIFKSWIFLFKMRIVSLGRDFLQVLISFNTISPLCVSLNTSVKFGYIYDTNLLTLS